MPHDALFVLSRERLCCVFSHNPTPFRPRPYPSEDSISPCMYYNRYEYKPFRTNRIIPTQMHNPRKLVNWYEPGIKKHLPRSEISAGSEAAGKSRQVVMYLWCHIFIPVVHTYQVRIASYAYNMMKQQHQ